MTKYERIEELVIITLDVIIFCIKGTRNFRKSLRKKVTSK